MQAHVASAMGDSLAAIREAAAKAYGADKAKGLTIKDGALKFGRVTRRVKTQAYTAPN